MRKPPVPENEANRLRDLERHAVLDTAPEADFDRITRIASKVVGTPIALVSLVDERRQWFKSRVGLDATETPREVAFCAHAIAGTETFVVGDALSDERFEDNPLVTGDPNVRFYAGALLTSSNGNNLGTLCVIDREPRTLTEDQRQILEDLAHLVVRELELRKAASMDHLTGAANRRMFLETAQGEFVRARRYGRNLSAIIYDLDHFKLVNDKHGHISGDEALKVFAGVCQDQIREQDYFGRLGGEEFGLLLVETAGEQALTVVNRMLRELSAVSIRAEDRTFSITASAGVASLRDQDETLGDLMIRADKALYDAKEKGRNQAALDS
ncbi:MAG: sensor domain-containing diguanylate cyclase [Alphaproteobacteria bacterium]